MNDACAKVLYSHLFDASKAEKMHQTKLPHAFRICLSNAIVQSTNILCIYSINIVPYTLPARRVLCAVCVFMVSNNFKCMNQILPAVRTFPALRCKFQFFAKYGKIIMYVPMVKCIFDRTHTNNHTQSSAGPGKIPSIRKMNLVSKHQREHHKIPKKPTNYTCRVILVHASAHID